MFGPKQEKLGRLLGKTDEQTQVGLPERTLSCFVDVLLPNMASDASQHVVNLMQTTH